MTKIEELEALSVEHGDARDLIRAFSGTSLTRLAERISVSRSTLNHTLAGYPGRTNPPVRRALEVELELPFYALDRVIPEG